MIDFYTPYPCAKFGSYNFKDKGVTAGCGKQPPLQGWLQTKKPRVASRPKSPGLARDQKAQGWLETKKPRVGSRPKSPGLARDQKAQGWLETKKPRVGSRPKAQGWLETKKPRVYRVKVITVAQCNELKRNFNLIGILSFGVIASLWVTTWRLNRN